MLTPLMHILSSLDEGYNIGHPVNILYLNKSDRDLVISGAKEFGAILNDEDKIWITDSPTGLKMVSDTQLVVGESLSFNPYTALLLTRVWECFDKYQHAVDSEEVDGRDDDLSSDSIVLRLEGNPRYIYVVVFNLMETPSLSYDEKMHQLQELLTILQVHSTVTIDASNSPAEQARLNRLSLQSKLSYWRKMLMGDYIRHYGMAPPPFTKDTVRIIRKEIADLGLYGFVDPYAMYKEFTSSRLSRKVTVNVDDSVITFLTKVVRSGGMMI